MKNRLLQAAFLLGALCMIALVMGIVRFYTGKPRPNTNYLAIINQPVVAAADDEKAWTIYRDLWIKYDFGEGGDGSLQELFVGDTNADGGWRLVRPDDGRDWQTATKKLASIEELLEGFRVGGLRPLLGVPLQFDSADHSEQDFQALYPKADYQAALNRRRAGAGSEDNEMMFSILLPHVQVMRKGARALVVDSRWALEQNDPERATRNIEAMLGMSRQVTDSKLYICSLFGCALHSYAMDLIDECLNSPTSFDDEQLKRIHSAVTNTPIDEMISFSTERAIFLDFVQKIYTDDGHGDGRITPIGIEILEEFEKLNFYGSQDQAPIPWFESAIRQIASSSAKYNIASRKQLTKKAEEFYDRAPQIFLASFISHESKAFEIDKLSHSYAPLKMLFRPMLMTRFIVARARGNSGGVSIALAVIRYQRQHGKLPESLNELVPEFLPEIPLDPIDHRPLRYQRRDDGFIVYSVGTNQIDNGGQLVWVNQNRNYVTILPNDSTAEDYRPMSASEVTLNMTYPGDWILWPRFRNPNQ